MSEQRPVVTKLEALRTLIQETQARTDHNWWHGDDFAAPLQLVEEALAEANKEAVVVLSGIKVTSVASGEYNSLFPAFWNTSDSPFSFELTSGA